ncbi:extracellular solute-binding protein [uncultured Sphaerochaeta sp.]|uniref:ABC transporter substrate-binding protein n=1 Tax=uncultured Sphaerochaeta sp. TaxID=886478 RepID=UPI002A0A1B33|nr:extracellular solute-binding protein [uncultured Sphaerochaeta sp.]
MSIRKKQFLIAVSIIILPFMLFANGSSEQAPKEATKTSDNTIMLNVLDYSDATAPGYEEFQNVWNNFTVENPNISLKKEDLTNEAFHQKMAAYVAAGTIPDVMYMYPSGRSAILHKEHLVKDLKPLLGEEFLSEFLPTATNPEGQSAQYLAELPQSICYSSVMYTNTKLLQQYGLSVPKTYADLKAMVPKLKAKGIQTVLMANKDDWVMQSCLFSTIAGRFVGKEWFDKVSAGTVKFTDPEFVAALQFVDQMYTDGVLSRDTIQLSYGEVPGLFAAGKAAFLIDGDWRQNAFITDKASGLALISPEDQQNNFSMMAFPSIPGEKFPGVISSTLGCGYGISASIPAGSAKEAAAVKLIKYLYSKDVQQKYLEAGRYITSRMDVKSDKLEPFTTKMMQYYSSVNDTCYVLDSALDPSVYTVLNKVLQEIGLGSKTPEQAASEVQAAMDTYLASQK